jgi:hypothetical protein
MAGEAMVRPNLLGDDMEKKEISTQWAFCAVHGVFLTPYGCPTCAAHSLESPSYEIQWDEIKKSFLVSMMVPKQFSGENGQFLQSLPRLIAELSSCSCGSSLQVGDFSFRVEKVQVHFSGKFYCSSCSGKGRPPLEKFKDAVAAVWNQITRLRLGTDGIEIEKKSPK